VIRLSPWIALPLGALASTALGVGIGNPWLFPVLGALVPFPVFLGYIRKGCPGKATAWVLYWCIAQSLALGAAVALVPERTAATVWHGPAYADEMLTYIRTGVGAEGSPRLFLPLHARHYVLLCVISLVTVGAGGLVLGTVLLNYMNFYVATLVRSAADPILALFFGWPVWAILRVVGYTATGAVMADVSWRLWSRWRGRAIARPFPVRLWLLGLGFALLDVGLKALVAPVWRSILHGALERS
jgi:hypothetical protein